MEKEYTIGLDIGTSSVGWAVMENSNWKLLRKGKKNLWGVRLFDQANSAESRRQERNARKRFDRRRKRLKLLREEFKEEIDKVDPLFFKKMSETFYAKSDTTNKTIGISKEENQLIREYCKKYPTIYHLRNDLVSSNEKMDIRLVYLAIHHIIKYRGNFLYNSSNFNVDNLNIKEKLISLFNSWYEINNTIEFYGSIDDIDYAALEKALFEKTKNDRKQKIKEVTDLFFSKETVSEFQKLLMGNIFSINKLFNLDNDEDSKISFKGTDFDDKYSDIEKSCGELIEVLNELKELYDMVFLKNLFKGNEHTNISSLMVSKFVKHQNDLKFLKDIFECDRKEYDKIFRTMPNKEHTKDACLYERYINNNISCEEFIKQLKKSFENIMDRNIKQDLLDRYTRIVILEMEEGTFLPRITDVDNGKYPYQLNKAELIKIIENQGRYYPFLKNYILNLVNQPVYKIVKLLEFKIPYYVGPLNNTSNLKGINNKNAWIRLKSNNVRITPYNFDEVVDKDASAEEFIKRMISHCTYLLDEYAIPANSILYSKFKVMNELKQISIDGQKISKELQDEIYNNLFLKTTKTTITESMLKLFLKQSYNGNMYNNPVIKGYSADKKFANNMKTYVDFFGENGFFKGTKYDIDSAEELIEWITIFEDKDILEHKILKKYTELTKDTIKRILSKKYTGWSELSRKLLTEVYYIDNETKQKKSIMDLMTETNENFMQIINNNRYKFQDKIAKLNTVDYEKKINYGMVERLVTSPAIKRGIWQALKIVDELVNYIGYEPKNISIEMARGEEEKKRTKSRKEYLLNLYNEFKNDIENYSELYKKLKTIDEKELTNQKLFLYFIQEGKSLYSMRPLDIDDLDKYEIDHIIPQTLIKDDSIDNKALVLREENQAKADNFVLPDSYRNKCNLWWNRLKNNNLISAKKLHNLTRKYYSKEDIEGFINRQLVETRQITKNVANILNLYYKDSNVIYLNANLSHNYREKNEIFKFRDINDYHHAYDAYLAAVLGEYKQTKIKNVDIESLKEQTKKMFDDKEYKKLKFGFVLNSMDVDSFDDKTGEIYNAKKLNERVINTLYKNDILVSKKTEIYTGQMYDETRYGKKDSKGLNGVSYKNNLDKKLYGGFSSTKYSYLVIVEYKDKRKMLGIPYYISAQNDAILIDRYIKENIKCEEYKIIKDKIPFGIKLKYDGCEVRITGASIELINDYQLKINSENMNKWKYTLNRLLNNKKNSVDDEKYLNDLKEIYNYLKKKISSDLSIFNSEINKIDSIISLENLELEQIETLIKQLFILCHANSSNADLKNISSSLGDRIGRMRGKNITRGILINQSVTGIRTRKYEF